VENKYPHPGITMHQLPVGSSFPGVLFAVGSALIFLFAIPALWYILVAAIVVGLIFAAVLQFARDSRESRESKSSMPQVYLQ
jgi:uncharacterized membrane protein (DUF106 family)